MPDRLKNMTEEYDYKHCQSIINRVQNLRPQNNQHFLFFKFMGAASVVLRDKKVWDLLENYLSEYEGQQPILPLGLTETLIDTGEKVKMRHENPLDRS